MARAQLAHTVVRQTGGLQSGATVTVNVRLAGTATLYLDETGGTTVTNPMTSDVHGRVEAWVDRGRYTVTVSHPLITAYSFEWDAIPAGDGTADAAWVADGAVQTAKIIDASIGSAEVAADAVTATEIAAGAVGTTEIAAGAVGASEIAAAQVTSAKIGADVSLGAMSFGFPFTIDPRVPKVGSSLGVNGCWYGRVYGGGSVSNIAFRVTAQAGNVSVAIYDSTGTGWENAPNSRLRTSGSVACPAAGDATVSVGSSLTVLDAVHWFCYTQSSASAAILVSRSVIFTAAELGNGRAYGQVVHPAPATAAGSGGISLVPVLIGA